MPLIPLNISAGKIEEIDAVCEILGVTRQEYVNWMFTFGKWVIAQAREGRVIGGIDPESGNYRELQSPHLERLQEVYRLLDAIKKK